MPLSGRDSTPVGAIVPHAGMQGLLNRLEEGWLRLWNPLGDLKVHEQAVLAVEALHGLRLHLVNLQTLATTWTSPVPAPAPEAVPCATCMECPCACAARADDARAKALEAVKAHTAVPQKYSHQEKPTAEIQSRRGHVKGVCVAYNRGYCRRGDDCRYTSLIK